MNNLFKKFFNFIFGPFIFYLILGPFFLILLIPIKYDKYGIIEFLQAIIILISILLWIFLIGSRFDLEETSFLIVASLIFIILFVFLLILGMYLAYDVKNKIYIYVYLLSIIIIFFLIYLFYGGDYRVCNDGWYTYSIGQGMCSHHGGYN